MFIVVVEGGAEGIVLRFMLMRSMMLSGVVVVVVVEVDLVDVGTLAKKSSLRRSIHSVRLAFFLPKAELLASLRG